MNDTDTIRIPLPSAYICRNYGNYDGGVSPDTMSSIKGGVILPVTHITTTADLIRAVLGKNGEPETIYVGIIYIHVL